MTKDLDKQSFLATGNQSILTQPKYRCPKHGIIIEEVINSTIPDFEGQYCMRCWVETLTKVEKIGSK